MSTAVEGEESEKGLTSHGRSGSGVDKSLVALFLRMTVEERLAANDRAIRTIAELRHAFREREAERHRPRHTS